MTRSELLLWQRWCDRRDQGAFRDLVAAHEAFVYDFARRLTGHAADAEDLTQDAFLELAEAPADKPPAVGLRAFLGRRLVLGARMLKRASLTRQRLEPRATAGTPAPVHPENAVENREAAEAALAELEPDVREALVLRFLHGLSYAEVAHVLGVKEGAARVRVHRGLERLKKRFGSNASACVAGLVLFAPKKSLAAPTAKAAVLLGGALVMSTAKKLGIAAVLVLLVGGGATLWRVSQRDEAPPPRTESTLPVTEPERTEPKPVAQPEAETEERKREAPKAVPLDAPIPKGRGSVSGTLKFADGTPAAGYLISLSGAPAKVVTTDAQGHFHLHDEWVDRRDLCLRGPRDYSLGIGVVQLKEDERVEVEVTLERGFEVAAAVVHAEGGKPVVGARVYLRADDHEQKQSRWGWVLLGPDGTFRFRHVLPGHYRIQVVDCPGLEPVSLPVEIKADTTRKIELKPGRPLVVQFHNLPAAWRGSKVTLMMQRMGGAFFSVDSPETKLDEQDRLVVDAPPPGRYHVTFYPGDSGMPRLNFGEYVVSKDPLRTIAHRFPNGARVVGTILKPDGKPLAKATVRLAGADAGSKTDEQGRFEIGFAREGRARIIVYPHGRTAVRIGEVDVPGSGSVRADVRIRGTATLTGEFDRTAERWGGSVELFRKGAKHATATWHFGTRREIRFDYIEAGEYEMRVWATNAEQVSRPLFVEEGAKIDLGEVKVQRFGKFPIRVIAPAGREVPRTFTAMFQSEKSLRSARIQLDADGAGTLTRVSAGKGKLWFTLNGCKSFARMVELKNGMQPLEIRLEAAPPKIEVGVRIEGPDDLDVPLHLVVHAVGRNGTASGTGFLVFPGHQRFGRLQNLLPGSYRLTIRHRFWKTLELDVEIRSPDQDDIVLRLEKGP